MYSNDFTGLQDGTSVAEKQQMMQKLVQQTKSRKKNAQTGASKLQDMLEKDKQSRKCQALPCFTPADLGYPVKCGPRPFSN
jgi:hypothetical protein